VVKRNGQNDNHTKPHGYVEVQIPDGFIQYCQSGHGQKQASNYGVCYKKNGSDFPKDAFHEKLL
jgi:hypothetical protein